MLIPYKFSLVRTSYDVEQRRGLSGFVRGRAWYPVGRHGGLIQIATHRLGQPVPHRRKVQVFWHETVHAILNEMGRRELRDNEEFVEEFAKRLTQIVYTAKVKL